MSAIFRRLRSERLRQTCIRLSFAGFLLRALVPVGFMPAALADGGPIAICHGGMAGAILQTLTANTHDDVTHAHMADHSAGSHDAHSRDSLEHDSAHTAWDHCPTGATAGAAALPTSFSFSLLSLSHSTPEAESQYGVSVALSLSYEARAPPSVLTR